MLQILWTHPSVRKTVVREIVVNETLCKINKISVYLIDIINSSQ
jgi:hypothetical protein